MKLKKSLGQNFFANPRLAEKIVSIVTQHNPSSIVEIGPGDGYFTKLFSEKVDKVTVIEKDTELASMLKVKLPKVTVLNQDILETDLEKLALDNNKTVCFGSLPYNISKRIISKLLTETRYQEYLFIIQREVADKYVQTESDTSILSIATKLYADSEIIMDIKPGAFIPAPKVTSSLIRFVGNNNFRRVGDTQKFLKLVKSAFSAPRKMLRNNLKGWGVTDIGVLNKRAADLSFNDYVTLANSIQVI